MPDLKQFGKNARSKRHVAIIGFAFFCFLFPLRTSTACGNFNDSFSGYSFLNPGIVNNQAVFAPFFLDFDGLLNLYGSAKQIQEDANLVEWRGRFCDLYTLESIKEIVYKAPLSDILRIQKAANDKKIKLPARLSKNYFASHLVGDKCLEVIKYLAFAKQCEPYVTAEGDLWSEKKIDANGMQRLIDEGLKVFKKTKSDYVRLRYAYQIIRLAHYMKDYEKTLELHDFLMPKIEKLNSILNYWIMGHRAGAMMRMGQRVEASYLFAKIFQNCLSKRESAFRSFNIKTQDEWNACMLLCEDDTERATLFAIRATAANSQAIEEMESIYRLDPHNDNLEILLIREIKKREKELLGREFDDFQRHGRKYHQFPDKVIGQKIINLQQFARRMRQEQKVKNPTLWQIAEGYLEFLAGDYYASSKTFLKASDDVKNDTLSNQLEAFKLALQIAAFEKPTRTVEEEVAEIRRNSAVYKDYPDFPDYLHDKMAQLYEEADRPGKAFRCHYNLQALKPNPREDIINDLLKVVKDPDKTRFERYLVEDKEHNSLKNDLLNIKAVMLMSEFQPEAALTVLKQMERVEWAKYGTFNPFFERLDECVNCPLPEQDSLQMFTRGEIIEKMVQWEYLARAEPENAGSYFYRLGLAWYNMSYFGYAWNVADFFRSGSSWLPWNLDSEDYVVDHYPFPYGNKENMDMTHALSYFERVRFLAKNPELKARATFMAAKCEQKAYYTSKDFKPKRCQNCIPTIPDAYQTYFEMLRKEYEDTEFYEQIVEECSYFRAYQARDFGE